MTFFEEFEQLRRQTPLLALMNFQSQNAEYGNFTCQCQNSYSNIGSDFLDGCLYNYWGYHNRGSTDCTYCRDCEDCYECLDSRRCSRSSFLQDCEDCEDSFACYDCVGLKDCFACIGLWRKQYHIYNKSYSKEQYFQRLERLKKKSPEELRALFRDVKTLRPHVYMHQNHNQGKCTGDYIYFSKTCLFCFDVDHSQDSFYMNNAINCRQCCDISFAGEDALKDCYEIMSGIGLENSKFCSQCWYGNNLEYCELCFNCEYCFGCVGLQGRKFYIFNKAHSPEAYFKEIERIKTDMKKTNSYGQWFVSQYPIEDTKMSEELAWVEHIFEKPKQPLLKKNVPLRKESPTPRYV